MPVFLWRSSLAPADELCPGPRLGEHQELLHAPGRVTPPRSDTHPVFARTEYTLHSCHIGLAVRRLRGTHAHVMQHTIKPFSTSLNIQIEGDPTASLLSTRARK